MGKRNPTPVCRCCGRPGKPARCSFCGRVKCEHCTWPMLSGLDCRECRVGVWTMFAGRRVRLMVAEGGALKSLCGGVSRTCPVEIEYLLPDAVEEAGRLKFELGRKGYLNVTIVEAKSGKES